MLHNPDVVSIETENYLTHVIVHVDGKPIKITIHDNDMTTEVLKWIRGIPKPVQMTFFAQLVLEYQLAAHINDKNEHDMLQTVNMEDEDLIQRIMVATLQASRMSPNGKRQVEIPKIYEYLERQHMELPPKVVYTVLKTLEHIDGRAIDIGEGWFTLQQPQEAHDIQDEEDQVSILKDMVGMLSEEGREQIQTYVMKSLIGTEYEVHEE